MAKHRGDFTQNFNWEDARLLFLCPKTKISSPSSSFHYHFAETRAFREVDNISLCRRIAFMPPVFVCWPKSLSVPIRNLHNLFRVLRASLQNSFFRPKIGRKPSLKSAKLYFCSDVWCVKGSRTNKKMQENIWRIIIFRSCHSRSVIWIIYRYFFCS